MDKRVVILGNFDGVHIAHQELIKNALLIAKRSKAKPLLVCFNPHTALVVKKGHKLLMPREDKILLIKEKFNIDVMELDFNDATSLMTYEDFLKNILLKNIDIHTLITGYNFRFGYNRDGDIKKISKFASKNSFDYICIRQMTYNHMNVASSNIKYLLSIGAVGLASKILGRNFYIAGTVVHGKKLGNKMGFRTLNIEYPDEQYIPLLGVYIISALFGTKTFYGVANIGLRPTLHQSESIILESHLFNFDQEIYENHIKVELLQFIRPERKFDTIEHLQAQIRRDISSAIYVLEQHMGQNIAKNF